MYKLLGSLLLVGLVAGCDNAVPACPDAPVNENIWQFADRNGFGLLVVACVLIWAVERTISSFARRRTVTRNGPVITTIEPAEDDD